MPYWVFDDKSQASKRSSLYHQFFYDEEEAALTTIQREMHSGEPTLREQPVILADRISRLLLFFLQNHGRELQIGTLCAALWPPAELREKSVHVTLRKDIEILREKLHDDNKELIRLGKSVGTYVLDADAIQYAGLEEFDSKHLDSGWSTGLVSITALVPDSSIYNSEGTWNSTLREMILLRYDGAFKVVGLMPEERISADALKQLLNRMPDAAISWKWADIGDMSDEYGITQNGLGMCIFREGRFRAYLGASSVRLSLERLSPRVLEPGGVEEMLFHRLVQFHPVGDADRSPELDRTVLKALTDFAASLRGFDVQSPDEEEGEEDLI